MLFFIFVCCFFKQKTAYEMRISDWSSDVCSSDLAELVRHDDARDDPHAEHDCKDLQPITVEVGVHALAGFQPQRLEHRQIARQPDRKGRDDEVAAHRAGELRTRENDRSEERRAGKEGVSTFRLLRMPKHNKNKISKERVYEDPINK